MKTCFILIQALAFAIASPSRSLPSFTLHEERLESGAPKVAITFPNGEVDNLILSEYISHEEDRLDEEENCDFVGHLENEKEACVAMTGCIGKEPVEFTILSKKSESSKTFMWHPNGKVELIESPFKDGKAWSQTIEPREDDGYHQVGDEEVNDAQAAEEGEIENECLQSKNCTGLPEAMMLKLRTAYGKNFLARFDGVHKKARRYIKKVLAHTQAYFCHETLGTKLQIKRHKGIKYLDMEIPATGDMLRELFPTVQAQLKGASLMSFFGSEESLYGVVGIAWRGTVCKYSAPNKYAANINEWRSTKASMAGLLAHELGHNLGMRHDHDDYHGGAGNECDKTGFMSYGTHPEKWSECSKNDFEAHFLNYQDKWCMGDVWDTFTC